MRLPDNAREYLAWIGQVLKRHTEKDRAKKAYSPHAVPPERVEAQAKLAGRYAKTPEDCRRMAAIWFGATIKRGGSWLFQQFKPEEADAPLRFDIAMGMYWLARSLNRLMYCDDIYALRLGAEMLFADIEVQTFTPLAVRDGNLKGLLLLCTALAGSSYFIPDATGIEKILEGVRASGDVEINESLKGIITDIGKVSPEKGGILSQIYQGEIST